MAVLAVCVAFVQSQWHGLNLTSLVVLGLAVGWALWLGTTTVYVVNDQGLLGQSGPIRRWVDAKLVETIRPTETVLAAPSVVGGPP